MLKVSWKSKKMTSIIFERGGRMRIAEKATLRICLIKQIHTLPSFIESKAIQRAIRRLYGWQRQVHSTVRLADARLFFNSN